ncbi:MAG: amino acid ABC transporter substrate-binding protein [Clostridia bacterium]|nr:amino acid ABC transporter substrate-binding protein [Clostridia bacterium]
MKKILAILIVAMFVLAGVSALAENGTLTLASNYAFAPYVYVDDENSEYTGIDVQIAKVVLGEMGYDIQYEDMEFGAIVIGVQKGKYDIGCGAITITEERKANVDFSIPYESAVQQVVVKADSELNTMEAVRAAADTILVGVQQDTTGQFYVEDDLCAANPSNCKPYKTAADAVQALKSGQIDVVVVDDGPAQEFLAEDDTLIMFVSDCAPEEYGFCFAKGSELLEPFNEVLQAKIDDGTVAAIFEQFKSAEEDAE